MKRTTLSLMALFFILLNPLSLIAAEQMQHAATPKTSQEQYERSMKERLGKLGEQLDNLKARAAAKSGQAEEKMLVYLAEAEEKRKAAALKLEEMKNTSKDKWEKFSSETEKAAKDFELAFEKAKSRFKE